MAIYSIGLPPIGFFSQAGTSVSAIAEVVPSPLSRVSLMDAEIAIGGSGANAAIAIGRPTTAGVTLNALSPPAEDPNDAPALTFVATEWTQDPVSPTNMLRRAALLIGNTGDLLFGFYFPRGLAIANGATLGIWATNMASNNNYSAAAGLSVNE